MTTEALPFGSFELVVELGPDPLIFADREGVIRIWNAAAARLFGHTPEEAIGQTLDLIVPERFRDQHWAGFHGALAAGETKYRGEVLTTRSMRKDGTTMYVDMAFSIVKDAGGVLGVLASLRDVTERFERERAARQAAAASQTTPAPASS